MDRRDRSLSVDGVQHPEDVAVVHRRRRPDHSEHRRPPSRPFPEQPAALFRLHARPRPLLDAGQGRHRAIRLGSGAPSLRRWPVSHGPEHELRWGVAVGRDEPAEDRPAGRPAGRPRRPRLGPDRLHRHGRPSPDEPLHRDERASDGPAVGPAEPLVRLRHAARHAADASSAPRIRMAWEGRWVSIQGIPGTASRASATGAPAPANATTRPPATPHPTATPRPTPTPTATPAATPAPTVGPTRSGAAIAVAPVVEPSSDPAAATSSVALPTAAIATGIGLALVVAVATCIALIAARSRRTVARE